ncbi:MAG: hypothetical protein HY883_02430 [Deltaproteobacteria bacterium]|nr:hypothetical protein [Deltaproteobacteria bacterium]
MDKEGFAGPRKQARQRYFAARELRFSIALLVVLALLGGLFLQSVAAGLTGYLGFRTPALGVFLIVGYVAIVGFLAIFFSHRLVGPFKRLEYEIHLVAAGELERRLTVRSSDDLHVRNFIEQVNDLLAEFEDMSVAYNKLNSNIALGLGKVVAELSLEGFDPVKVSSELKFLQAEIHRHREKW